MYNIIEKQVLNPQMTRLRVQAPLVAKKALAGQFVILRVNETGERVPFTIADYSREAGWIDIIYQTVGKTTMLMDTLQAGDAIADFAGPLGKPTELEGYQNAVVVGGGAGCAIAYPSAKALHAGGARVTMVAGFRSAELIMLENEMHAVSDELLIMTDDGSNGRPGFVTNALQALHESGARFDLCVAIGPIPMMRAVAELTRPWGLKTIVSLNPIMVDGTGMCGGCRVTVGGQVKFACVDGPDFDGHLVDFDELRGRNGAYRACEQEACRLFQSAKEERR
ncbi:MAG: sulfide/dihydroorotate dehydrogenase-like FAD/NAD-binding protein [Oscillospiraceae bacterium]|jgi:ferredoxin--NADP+ reductase|nr:sulfide/dihydroorotate dehydrogenase-like FAD/NAD-binding protein [Oscillospiraceae bacterium]